MDTQISISVTDAPPGGGHVRLPEVNCHLSCPVCKGYLVDATTITECLHSFCRSCVVPHVSEHFTCPQCSVPLSTTKPFSQLRRDYTLQTIVYKMVPRLARAELERRQKFANGRSEYSNSATDERYLESFIAPDDPISLSLEYAEPNCAFGLRRFGEVQQREHEQQQREQQQQQQGGDHERRRYFRCPANLPVGHLVKFLRCKFNVLDTNKHKLEVLYNGHPLAPEYKLADVAYIFSWKEMEPLRLWYRISAISENQDAARVSAPIETRKRQSKPKKKPLVDITHERTQRPAKRRKRTPPPADEDDVKLSTLLPDASKQAPKSNDTAPVESSEAKAEDNNNKTNAIFDRPAEFSCSTPLPEAEVKVKSWLPKTVFDLDDRDLFAKRLQKITKEEGEEGVKEEEEKSKETREEQKEEEEKQAEPMSPSSPLNPLRICVTPEPSSANNEAVHDSIGALDLSGSSKSDGETTQPSPGTSNLKTPHPYFMTPIFEEKTKKKTPSPPALPIKKPPVKLLSPMLNPTPPILKSPLWNLINQVPMSGNEKGQPHKTLFDFFKSNPFLFKPTTSGPAQKSPKSSKNTTTSPKSI